MPDVRRRELIAMLGGPAATWPMVARAQQRAKPPRIGFLGIAFERTAGEWLRAGLRDLGYVEDTNIIIEWQWAQNVDELPALVAELVRMDVDVIFAHRRRLSRRPGRRPRQFPSCSRSMPTRWA